MLSGRQKHFGARDLSVAETLVEMGLMYDWEDESEKGVDLIREALTIQEETLRQDHPIVASTLTALGDILQGLGKLEEAEKLLHRAVEIQRDKLPPEHCGTSRTLIILGRLYVQLGKPGQAEPLLREAMDRATRVRRWGKRRFPEMYCSRPIFMSSR